jgi:hypothetical protein
MMPERLIQVLNAVGKPTEFYRSPDGSIALVLPYGGRVLGLFAPQSEENFFWTHSALASRELARAFYDGNQWHNSGGDRTWLAPEADFFFPDFPSTNKYWQPRELDPGNYQVARTGGTLSLVNRLAPNLSRSKRKVALEITKALTPAPNPLRYERSLPDPAGTEYAGYTLQTSLELLEAKDEESVQVGLWNLLQLPPGGELLAPTYARTQPKMILGTIPPGDLTVEENLIRYRMRAAGVQKLSLRAVTSTGRVGYLYPTGDRFALVVRNCLVNPSGEYIDVPWDDTGDLGYSIQACRVDNEFGNFSELEYHMPAIGRGTGRRRSEDTSQVWAFRGSREQIRAIVKTLLSVSA